MLPNAGHDDWRLPNLTELQSIVDYGRDDPSIDPVFGAVSDYYWTSDTYTTTPALAWVVHFVHGHTVDFGKSNRYYVRPVRSGR